MRTRSDTCPPGSGPGSRPPAPSRGGRPRRRVACAGVLLAGAALLFPVRAGLAARAAAAGAPAASAAAPARDDARLSQVLDGFYAEYPRLYPSEATDLGLHERDGELEDLSAAGLAREQAFLKAWDGKIAAVPLAGLSIEGRFDAQLVRQSIAARLFDLEKLQSHRRRASVYLGLCSHAINSLINRDYAPAAIRLRAVVARAGRIPQLLRTAEQNLDLLSPASVDITLRNLDATVEFFRRDVPAAFESVKDAAAQAELRKATEGAAKALEGFGAWLRKDGRARATQPFQLGPERFKEALWALEMIDEPTDSLLTRAEAELRRLQTEFRATARKISATKSAAEVQLDLQKDHPPADRVIPETQARLLSQQKFLVDHGIVTVPSDVLPQVKETPPFRRATTLASMDTPGPFEASKEAYYYVTLPEPTWPESQREDFLRGAYSRPLIDVVSIHEAFPGHYVQFLWGPRLSRARKFTDFSANSEGWAHYTEQMMLDEGYAGGDARVRLMQLQDALLRAARFVVAIRMHAKDMTQAQAAEFFFKEGLQTQQVAEIEARRGTEDPMYLVYTYGKLEIFKLRAEWQRQKGSGYSLRGFHDALLSYGRGPLRLVRAAMLGTL